MSRVVGRSDHLRGQKFDEVLHAVCKCINNPDKERLSVMLINAIAPTSEDASAFAVGQQEFIHCRGAVFCYLDLKGYILNFSAVFRPHGRARDISRSILMSWTGWVEPFHGVLANSDLSFSPWVTYCSLSSANSFALIPQQHGATLAPVETTTATPAVPASCDAPRVGKHKRAACAFSVPMWVVRVRHVCALSPRGLFDFATGFATCVAFQHHAGHASRSAARHAMRVTSVPTRAGTALVHELAHLETCGPRQSTLSEDLHHHRKKRTVCHTHTSLPPSYTLHSQMRYFKGSFSRYIFPVTFWCIFLRYIFLGTFFLVHFIKVQSSKVQSLLEHF